MFLLDREMGVLPPKAVSSNEAVYVPIPPFRMPSFFVLSEGISGAVEPLTTGPWAEVRGRPRPMEIFHVPQDIVATCGEFLATYQTHLASPVGRLGIFSNKCFEI